MSSTVRSPRPHTLPSATSTKRTDGIKDAKIYGFLSACIEQGLGLANETNELNVEQVARGADRRSHSPAGPAPHNLPSKTAPAADFLTILIIVRSPRLPPLNANLHIVFVAAAAAVPTTVTVDTT